MLKAATYTKDERVPGPSGIPEPDRATQKKIGHGDIFCLTGGTVQSRIQEMGWVENEVVSLSAGIFCCPGLNEMMTFQMRT